MLAHAPFGLFCVPSPQRFHDLAVLGEGGFHFRGNPPRGQTIHPDMIVEARYELNEPLGIGKVNDALMKFKILPSVTLNILVAERFAETLSAGLQLG